MFEKEHTVFALQSCHGFLQILLLSLLPPVRSVLCSVAPRSVPVHSGPAAGAQARACLGRVPSDSVSPPCNGGHSSCRSWGCCVGRLGWASVQEGCEHQVGGTEACCSGSGRDSSLVRVHRGLPVARVVVQRQGFCRLCCWSYLCFQLQFKNGNIMAMTF